MGAMIDRFWMEKEYNKMPVFRDCPTKIGRLRRYVEKLMPA